MFRENVTLITFTLFLILFCDTTSLKCKQLTACSCVFPDGQGYNLTNLANEGILTASNGPVNITFQFQPCKNVPMKFNVSHNECEIGTSLCQYNRTSNSTYNLGTVEETKIQLQSGKIENVVLILHHGNRTTLIETTCCNHCDTHLNVNSKPTDMQYNLTLESQSACKALLITKGLSTGSVLVILLFVFSGIYFIGGALTLKFLRGATGWEMLPNHELWCELPSLVRDGIMYTFNCCQADSYQRI